MKILKDIGKELGKYYGMYSDFIHSIFPDQLGDLVVYIINIALAVLLVRLVAKAAFGSKNGGYTSE